MWNWIVHHANTLSVVVNLSMLLFWIVYVNAIWWDYHRRHRPKILIEQARGHDMEASAMVVNLSGASTQVEAVVARVTAEGQTHEDVITRYLQVSQMSSDDHQEESRLKQGPLHPSDYMLVGTFEGMIRGAMPSDQSLPQMEGKSGGMGGMVRLEVDVIAMHAQNSDPVAARRRFQVFSEGQSLTITPEDIHTEQFVSFFKRRIAQQWLERVVRGQRLDGSSPPRGPTKTNRIPAASAEAKSDGPSNASHPAPEAPGQSEEASPPGRVGHGH